MSSFTTSNGSPLKVVVADKSPLLCELMRYNLEREGYDVTAFQSAEMMLKADKAGYALLVLDDSMIGDPVEIVSEFRYQGRTTDVAVMLLTIPERSGRMLEALDCGVDDILIKPFSMKVLAAKVNALVRRRLREVVRIAPTIFRHDDLEVNIDTLSATLNDEPIALTAEQCRLLAYLILHRNSLFTAAELARQLSDFLTEDQVKPMIDDIRSKIGTYSLYLIAGPSFAYIFTD